MDARVRLCGRHIDGKERDLRCFVTAEEIQKTKSSIQARELTAGWRALRFGFNRGSRNTSFAGLIGAALLVVRNRLAAFFSGIRSSVMDTKCRRWRGIDEKLQIEKFGLTSNVRPFVLANPL
jgi:hypothetical protein